MWNNTEKSRTGYGRQQRMRIACWTPKSKNKILEYVILTAFPPQQGLHKTRLIVTLHVHCYVTLRCYVICTLLRYMYIACLAIKWQRRGMKQAWRE